MIRLFYMPVFCLVKFLRISILDGFLFVWSPSSGGFSFGDEFL